ncbi:jg12209 [Pararge aegeria aegeria]|uniref:Jg12209 protein n=1 Tax=Pararge aegeria aegeria TaxID=348720 RepID=A0A8S4QQU3_9NEOP|nr:jg12209 [Pararge aegeria aegeria]
MGKKRGNNIKNGNDHITADAISTDCIRYEENKPKLTFKVAMGGVHSSEIRWRLEPQGVGMAALVDLQRVKASFTRRVVSPQLSARSQRFMLMGFGCPQRKQVMCPQSALGTSRRVRVYTACTTAADSRSAMHEAVRHMIMRMELHVCVPSSSFAGTALL